MTTIDIDSTVRSALAALDSTEGVKSLIVTDARGTMQGTLTDGDIRRGLLHGATLDDTVARVCHRSYTALCAGDDPIAVLDRCRQLGIRQLPVLDSDGHILHVYDLDTLDTIVPLRALMMAGGRGERLRPLTDTTPKPLLPVGDVPIIDRNINLMRRAGIRDITVSTGYMHGRFAEHFNGRDGVTLLPEERPLGTIGALAMLDSSGEDVLVMNADLMTTFSLERMYLTHRRSDADITIGSIPYTVSIPYAIIDTDSDGHVTALHEKPVNTYAANAGIYIIAARIISTLTAGERLDAPELIEQVISRGGRVSLYPLDGSWIDIGTPADYARACDVFVGCKSDS